MEAAKREKERASEREGKRATKGLEVQQSFACIYRVCIIKQEQQNNNNNAARERENNLQKVEHTKSERMHAERKTKRESEEEGECERGRGGGRVGSAV